MTISLAGAPLYKRGYRSVLRNSAPLREDIAAACMQKAWQFGVERNDDFEVDTLLVPFSGTGTFLFEYLLAQYQFTPVLFDRKYALQDMPLYRPENFNYLLKKACEYCAIDTITANNFYCIDNADTANAALLENMEIFKASALKNNLSLKELEAGECLLKGDFLKQDVASVFAKLNGNIFIPLNPPYGIRLGKSDNPVVLYKQIAGQIRALSRLAASNKKNVLGFILCPTEESWSAFCKDLSAAAIETYHINQGGLDIRVAQFYI